MNYFRLLTTTLITSTLCTQSVFAADKINVVASFSILGDLVQQVGSEHVSVSTLVGPNGDAHVYQPTPQDTIRLTKSQLFVVNGLGFEGWMERLVSASHYKGKVITASQGITPQTFTDADDNKAAPHVAQDPHAWHNIPNALQYVHNIADGLSQIDPEHKVEYQANAGNYIQRLEQLDKSLLAEFAAIPANKRKMITSHDAFGYLSARYQITTIAPQGMSTESEASASDVAKIIKQIRKEHIKALFVENISDPRLMQQISKETGVNPGKELFSDALSDKSGPASTYLDMMHYNTTQILSALKQ
ncbi:MAG: metal ABC transporter substrate-binding protein [Tolumonas sp.]|nr:metal ABC transporter substrate-binding protein [Tolumonas sp.]